MILGSAESLPWPDKYFDVVLSINTAHNLSEEKCRQAIREMTRVGKDKKKMLISVDAYRNEQEKERMKDWVLTAETVKSVAKAFDKDIRIKFTPKNMNQKYITFKIKVDFNGIFNFKPDYSFEEGIKEFIAWYKNYYKI